MITGFNPESQLVASVRVARNVQCGCSVRFGDVPLCHSAKTNCVIPNRNVKMTDIYDEPSAVNDMFWITPSEIQRKAPGLAVVGRVWANIHPRELHDLVGAIFVDSPNMTFRATLVVEAGFDGHHACCLSITSVEQEIISFDAMRRDLLDEYLIRSFNDSETSKYTTSLYFHHAGWFWEEVL